MSIKNLFRRIFGTAVGCFEVIPTDSSHYVKIHLPFTPKKVYVNYDVKGIGCGGCDCEICIEKTWCGFVIYYSAIAEKIDFSWIATRY